MPNPHPLYEDRLPCFRAYATNAYASELHKKREDPRYGITAADILMEAHDKIAGRKNEASSVTAASRISDKALQAMLVGGWQPAELQAAANDEGGDLYLDAGAELTERGSRHSPAPEAQPGQALPGPRHREGRFRHNSSFAAHAAASSFLAGVLDKQRMAGADAQGVEHQGGGPRGVQWAEEPRHAPGGDSEDGTAARVQVSRAGPRFLRKAISEKASSAARWELMQPAGELAPEAPSPPTSPSSSTPGSLVLPGLSFDKARAGLRRMSSLACSSVSADVEALISRTNSHLSPAAADAAVRQLQPHLPDTPPHAALTEGRGSYAEGAGAVCHAAAFATASVAAVGSSDGGDHSSRRGSLDERQYVPAGSRSTLGGAAQGSRRSFERPSLECDAAAAGRPRSSQPLLSRTHSRRNSVAFVGTRSTNSLPTLAMASHPAHPAAAAPACAATSPKEALGEAHGLAGWTQRLLVETGPVAGGAGPCVGGPALSPGGSAGHVSYASAAPAQYKRSSLDLSAFAPPQGGAPLAGSVRRCSVDLPSPTAAAAAASVASEREETCFKSVVHRLRKGAAVLPRSADALTANADGLASARHNGDHPRSLSPAAARSYASSPHSPLSPAATPAASSRGLARGDRDRRRLASFEDDVSLA